MSVFSTLLPFVELFGSILWLCPHMPVWNLACGFYLGQFSKALVCHLELDPQVAAWWWAQEFLNDVTICFPKLLPLCDLLDVFSGALFFSCSQKSGAMVILLYSGGPRTAVFSMTTWWEARERKKSKCGWNHCWKLRPSWDHRLILPRWFPGPQNFRCLQSPTAAVPYHHRGHGRITAGPWEYSFFEKE